ncbi:MAG: peptidoglycan DD-metalloendopeptidase family protein [Pseudomonadota bacterium]
MSRLLILVMGMLIGAVGAGMAMTRVKTAPSTVPVPVAACPPIPAAVLCPTTDADIAAAPVDAVLAEAVPTMPQSPAVAASASPDAATVNAAEPPSPVDSAPLLIPVSGIASSQLRDTFSDARGSNRVHDAIDIMASKGTPIVAAVEGRVVKLFNSVPGGLTLYQFDASERHAYYYAHLDGYAPGLAEGQLLKRGELLGFVGYSGNASPNAPHLHFAIFELGPEKRWWQGTAINPYPLLLSGRSP